jgi:hypothetical protein
MNRKLALALSVALALLAVIVLVYRLTVRSGSDESSEAGAAAPGTATEVEAGKAVLYFPGRGDKLYPERRALSAELEGEARIRLIVTELLLGPTTEELVSALPADLEIGGVSLDPSRTLFLDLSSKAGALRGLGSTAEMLAVYSLVNTVILNEPQVHAVVLLWNGRQYPSLAGHVDTTYPLTVNSRLIAESS